MNVGESLTDLVLRPILAHLSSTLLRLAESTSKTMAELAARGIIRQGRARVSILDMAALSMLARLSG